MTATPASEYNPGSREIVATIIGLWQDEPETESLSYSKLLARVKEAKAGSQWVLSEKRMKAALKEFNLQPNQPAYTYVKQTVSDLVPTLKMPAGTQLQMTKARGKAIYATKSFREGDKLWEETPLVQAASVEMLRLMRAGRCCAYCAKLLRTTPEGAPMPRTGIPCVNCTANWCSNNCKRLDVGHADTYHDRAGGSTATRPHIAAARWKIYEQFCMDQNWNAGYSYAVALLHRLKHGSNSEYARTLRGMARIRQDLRQRAVSDPDSLEFEQHESMWRRGHQLLSAAVKPLHTLSYGEYLEGIGLVNINNVKGCIFAVHANLNHSCEPNVRVDFRSDSKADGIVVYARRDIDAGQELVTSYVNPALGVSERQSELRINWGFLCGCKRCKREKTAKLAPIKPAKPALKSASPSPPPSPIDTPVQGVVPGLPTRRKSVHFENNPVSLTISSSC